MELDFGFGNTYIWQEWYNEKEIKLESTISCLYQLKQPGSSHLEEKIRSFHTYHGYTISSKTAIITGLGSTQVILGLIHALSILIKEVTFLEQVPTYLLHQSLVESLGHKYLPLCSLSTALDKEATSGSKANKDVQGSTSIEADSKKVSTIEFVTSPNNPDGSIRTPVTKAPIILWDAVYAWPWYGYSLSKLLTSIKESTKGRLCIPIFSFSKSMGLAGQRVGYALIPSSVQKEYPLLLDHYRAYISTNTLGTCRSGEGICKVISSGYKNFPEIGQRLEHRFNIVSKKLYKIFQSLKILSPKGFPYMWLYLSGENLYKEFQNLKVAVLPGEDFGTTNEYVRINLMASTSDINKLTSLLNI